MEGLWQAAMRAFSNLLAGGRLGIAGGAAIPLQFNVNPIDWAITVY
jgi:hypothetical protein